MTFENAVVLVNNVAIWSSASVVYNGSTLQVLVPNGTGGSDIAATFTADFSTTSSGAVQIYDAIDGIYDQDGHRYDEIRVIPQGRGCGCNK